MNDTELLRQEANSMSKKELVDYYWTYYSQDRDEMNSYSVAELRHIFVEGEAR